MRGYRSVMDMSRDEWAAQAEQYARTQSHAQDRVSRDPADWLSPAELAEARALAAQLVKETRRALNAAARGHDKRTLPRWVRNGRLNVSDAVRELREAEQDTDMGGQAHAWFQLRRYAEEHAGDATVAARARLEELTDRMRTARDTAAQAALEDAIAREVARRNSDEGWEQELRRRERVRRGPTRTVITVHDDGTTTGGAPHPFRMPEYPVRPGR
ncbi:hypothetical protein [Streptomyces roseochromogenus]|uniref:Uncharacterized protein n=1 Tax=Streptomyces roseochromogenus subsp. oscitans DS 12.976 TaxID=1352936 RepID=V6JDT4_STRRC|nr:hypothetical protein [Streptomyces roseochromogenus]EST18062.1 hypothetical protein M878_45705 [Streptomyces roseochromogenus subsp. oscitans DS 12.976]